MPRDGHACYSPDRRWILTDTNAYRQDDRLARGLFLYGSQAHAKVSLGLYHAGPRFAGDIRCDLHPRWSPDGKLVTFDSVHEGTRQIYVVDVSEIVGC